MGSKNNKSGENKADKANEQVQKQQEAIQATEAKEVRSTPYGRSLGRGLADTSKYSGNLKGAIDRANFRNSVLGRNPALNQLADPLGRSGLTTDRFGRVRNTGEYNVTPGGMQDTVRGTLGSRDISQLGRMIDSGNFANLNEQAAANRMFGFNPTKGMGILDSLRYGATNPEAKRGYQRLGNLAKGIATLSPVQNVFRGMLGIDPVQMTEINPYNIGPGFSEFPNRFDMFSNPELEGMTENAVYSRLFNDVAPVQTGMFNPPAEQTVGQPIQSVTETTNMPGMEGIPDMFPDNQGVPTYDFDKIINGDYYEQDPRSLGSGDLPASEMGAFSNMQNTNTFNLFNPDTYPNIGGFMGNIFDPGNIFSQGISNPSSPVFDGNSMYEGQLYDPAFDESSGISDSYMQANPNRFFNV